MSAKGPGLSHPSVLNASATGEPLPLRLPRPCSPRPRRGAVPQGRASRFTRARPSALAPAAGTDVPPTPLPRAYRRDSCLAPAARPSVPPVSPRLPPLCSRRQSLGVLRRGGEEKLPSTCCPRSFASPACGTCKVGKLSHTIYRRLDLPVTSILVLSMKYFDWHPSLGEIGKMRHGNIRNEVIPHVGPD